MNFKKKVKTCLLGNSKLDIYLKELFFKLVLGFIQGKPILELFLFIFSF